MLAFKKNVDVFNYNSRIKRNKEGFGDIFNKPGNARNDLRLPLLVFQNKPENALLLVISITTNRPKRESRAVPRVRDSQAWRSA